ncbi:class I SAM-dependent methyltransferase [Deltaproteobacteria bacterium TL4]
MHLKHRKTCRICGSTHLTKVIDLGKQHLQGSFVKEGKELPPLRKIQCELVRCDPTIDEMACGLLQMSHSVPPEILYSAYWYRSGTNQTMRDHLKGIVDSAVFLLGKQEDVSVLDIGCNDGTLLKNYPATFSKFGVDPSDVATEIGEDIQVIHGLYPSQQLHKVTAGQKFDIITSIAMFYDLESPVDFVKAISNDLKEEGIWVFEMSYMPSMLKMNSYDTICHEHLEYYSLSVLDTCLKYANMKVFKAELNEINGGSIRCYATHNDTFKYQNRQYSQELYDLRRKEFDLALDEDTPYKDFQMKINKHKEELNSILRTFKREGKRVHIYGASTKGNTILQFCGIDNAIIDFAAERNPDKYGAKTLGTGIPIISEAESRSMKPDYYLVLPWHFKEEFLEREKKTIESGIKMIFPLPEVEIIG